MSTFLETERLIFKAPSMGYLNEAYLLDADPQVMEFMGGTRTFQSVQEWLEKNTRHQEKHGFGFGFVFEKETSIFIGRAGILYLAYDETQPELEIVYRLHRAFWDKGYGTEIAQGLIKWGFENLSINKLVATAHPENKRSCHVIQKVGMHYVGKHIEYEKECNRYEITQATWQKEKMNKNQAELYKQYNYWQVAMGKKLMAQVNIHPHQHIIDVGCGTGELTYLLAEKISPDGQLDAIDPDTERLIIARNHQPKLLKNIHWHNVGIEHFNSLEDESIDIVYSNYALHWVKEKNQALANLHRLLKPGGQLVMNCIAEHSKIIFDLENKPEDSMYFANKYPLTNKKDWLALLNHYNFKILSVNTGCDCILKNLDEFLIFWEATTHGKFLRATLPDTHYHFLIKKYPGKIALFGEETLNVVAVK